MTSDNDNRDEPKNADFADDSCESASFSGQPSSSEAVEGTVITPIGDAEDDPLPEENKPPADFVNDEELSWGDRMLVSGRELSPRHRKLAELKAQGFANKDIALQLGYTDSRVSILLSNTKVREEVDRIRERIYEETIGRRLKAMAEPALNEIQRCITDQTNKYPERLKVETSRWVVEKIDGKAVQKHDIGENLLGIMMDKIDALKGSSKDIDSIIDATPLQEPTNSTDLSTISQIEAPKADKTEEDLLKDWIIDFKSK
jgi:DNA-binding CsgD family transcriptional regulator